MVLEIEVGWVGLEVEVGRVGLGWKSKWGRSVE
jgi:hypothetical protein